MLNARPDPVRLLTVWKDYYFIPEAQRIEHGMLLFPVNFRGEFVTKKRVLKTLNSFPENWKDFECVYRQIESHWFLRMCNGH